jgi:hypothetical protein
LGAQKHINRTVSVAERGNVSFEHSLPFSLHHRDNQVGFARVLTNYVVLAFLADERCPDACDRYHAHED